MVKGFQCLIKEYEFFLKVIGSNLEFLSRAIRSDLGRLQSSVLDWQQCFDADRTPKFVIIQVRANEGLS